MSPEPVAAWNGSRPFRGRDPTRQPRESTSLPDWAEPADFPPLPAELAGRARSILERQRSTAERASAARREIGRELTAVRALPAAGGTQLPRYLDRLA